jgi:hypothetical protein
MSFLCFLSPYTLLFLFLFLFKLTLRDGVDRWRG